MDPIYQFAGRLHPLILHAPIGLAIGLVALELWAIVRRRPLGREVRSPLAWLTALSAAAAVASGLILENEGYTNDTVQLHKWLAIGVGVASLLAAGSQQVGRLAWYGAFLTIATGALIPAGHFGASMTHGADFLFEPFEPFEPAKEPPVIVTAPEGAGETSVYLGVVAPILEARCNSCHGAERDKGGLRLHTPDAIMLGGDLGPVIEAGEPSLSELTRRMRLPLDDDDHMPPKSKPQPTEEEIAALEAWIATGASFTGEAAAAAPTGVEEVAATDVVAPVHASREAIDEIRSRLVHVEPVAQGSNFLMIDTSAVAVSVNDEALAELLEGVREHVSDLMLARTSITDASMGLIASLPNLRRLNLSSTGITDTGMDQLRGHPVLAELVLTQTGVTDSSYDVFLSMPGLARLYVWKSRMTPGAIADLREELPRVVVDAGDTPDAALVEETAITLTSDGAAGVGALKLVNSLCPVSGKPIDAAFALVHQGRVIGFCCGECLKQFVDAPAKFEVKGETAR